MAKKLSTPEEPLSDQYSLDVVNAVGYRVRSNRTTQFRHRGMTHARGLLVKGLAVVHGATVIVRAFLRHLFQLILSCIRSARPSDRPVTEQNPVSNGCGNGPKQRDFEQSTLDLRGLRRYFSLRIPAGPLPQGTLSLGGFFFLVGSLA